MTGVPETKAQTDRDSVFDAKDLFDGKMKLAESGQKRSRSGAKGVASAKCRIRTSEVIGYGVRRQELINRFEPALVPHFLEPAADDRGVFVFDHEGTLIGGLLGRGWHGNHILSVLLGDEILG